MNPKFCRYVLRTTDAVAARAFYERVLGTTALDVFPLHEQALARGARPHWLGEIGVQDVDAMAARFVARGATRLGPTATTPAGVTFTVLRDPGGAVVSLASPWRDTEPARAEVVRHDLNVNDLARTSAVYVDLFDWQLREPIDLGPQGTFRAFAFEHDGPSVGSMADLADRPGVHPHWLFSFRVSPLDAAMTAVREGGGLVAAAITLPTGGRIAVCDDPQGAAFGLVE